jgi:hypothetical protein
VASGLTPAAIAQAIAALKEAPQPQFQRIRKYHYPMFASAI